MKLLIRTPFLLPKGKRCFSSAISLPIDAIFEQPQDQEKFVVVKSVNSIQNQIFSDSIKEKALQKKVKMLYYNFNDYSLWFNFSTFLTHFENQLIESILSYAKPFESQLFSKDNLMKIMCSHYEESQIEFILINCLNDSFQKASSNWMKIQNKYSDTLSHLINIYENKEYKQYPILYENFDEVLEIVADSNNWKPSVARFYLFLSCLLWKELNAQNHIPTLKERSGILVSKYLLDILSQLYALMSEQSSSTQTPFIMYLDNLDIFTEVVSSNMKVSKFANFFVKYLKNSKKNKQFPVIIQSTKCLESVFRSQEFSHQITDNMIEIFGDRRYCPDSVSHVKEEEVDLEKEEVKFYYKMNKALNNNYVGHLLDTNALDILLLALLDRVQTKHGSLSLRKNPYLKKFSDYYFILQALENEEIIYISQKKNSMFLRYPFYLQFLKKYIDHHKNTLNWRRRVKYQWEKIKLQI